MNKEQIIILILSLILYLFIGLFICNKRNWYKSYDNINDSPPSEIIFIAISLMPINFIMVFYKEFILREWDND